MQLCISVKNYGTVRYIAKRNWLVSHMPLKKSMAWPDIEGGNLWHLRYISTFLWHLRYLPFFLSARITFYGSASKREKP